MDKNARTYMTAYISLTLAGNDIEHMTSLAYSPNIIFIQQAWDSFGRRIAQSHNSL